MYLRISCGWNNMNYSSRLEKDCLYHLSRVLSVCKGLRWQHGVLQMLDLGNSGPTDPDFHSQPWVSSPSHFSNEACDKLLCVKVFWNGSTSSNTAKSWWLFTPQSDFHPSPTLSTPHHDLSPPSTVPPTLATPHLDLSPPSTAATAPVHATSRPQPTLQLPLFLSTPRHDLSPPSTAPTAPVHATSRLQFDFHPSH